MTLVERVGQVAPTWVPAFEAVPREWFVPDVVWRPNPAGRGWLSVERTIEPQRWAERVAADDFVITQVDDGHPALPGGVGRAVTSSTSMPTVMAVMLEALSIDPDHRVLEIGTATGWNAALLAAMVGGHNVTTVEIDPALAQHARTALAARGITATVVCGDGETGHAPNAPYDRVLCTAGCHWVPYAWVEQCAAGGVIVTPWQTPYLASALLRLEVRGDGTAAGRFIDHASFMSLRGQRIGDWIPDPRREREVSESVTALHPYEPVSDNDGCAFAVSVLVSGIEKSIVFPDPADRRTYQVLIYDEGSRSWATIDVDPAAMDADRYRLRQHGTRRLWEEIESAHGWWARQDRPTFTDFGLTVGRAEQHVWLGDPSQRIAPIAHFGSREMRAG